MSFYDWGNPPRVETEGELTNPTTATVMADTGALAAGRWHIFVSIGCSVAGQFQIQRRNAANGANVGDVPVKYIAAGQSAQFVYQTVLEAGERVRVLPDDNVTGTAVADLVFQQMT